MDDTNVKTIEKNVNYEKERISSMSLAVVFILSYYI